MLRQICVLCLEEHSFYSSIIAIVVWEKWKKEIVQFWKSNSNNTVEEKRGLLSDIPRKGKKNEEQREIITARRYDCFYEFIIL